MHSHRKLQNWKVTDSDTELLFIPGPRFVTCDVWQPRRAHTTSIIWDTTSTNPAAPYKGDIKKTVEGSRPSQSVIDADISVVAVPTVTDRRYISKGFRTAWTTPFHPYPVVPYRAPRPVRRTLPGKKIRTVKTTAMTTIRYVIRWIIIIITIIFAVVWARVRGKISPPKRRNGRVLPSWPRPDGRFETSSAII